MKTNIEKQPEFAINKGWYDLLTAVASDYKLSAQALIPEAHQQQFFNNQLDVRLARQLSHRMVEASGDELLPVNAAENIDALSFGTLTLVLWTSPNLYQLMQHCAEYSTLFGSPVRVIFKETPQGDGEFWLLDIDSNAKQVNVTHVGLMLVIATLGQFILKTTTCDDLTFDLFISGAHISVASVSIIESKYNCRLHLNSPVPKLRIARKYLFRSLKNAKHASGSILLQAYKVFDDADNLAAISGEVLAKALRISVRTLNRRLGELDTNYRSLIDKYKLEKAMNMLHQSDSNLSEIAFQLGFSDLSTFSRAFKRWTGTCPSKIA
ncbi:MAG: AraC-like DNA-binding protein [Moritella sp.]|jgi:AraC-like DNA-binding protein